MRTIKQYGRYQRHINAWRDGDIEFLAVFGPPGVGKTHAYLACLGNRAYLRFGGRQSPLEVYKALHDAPHLPVVFDDVAALLRDDCFRDMLKGLCDAPPRIVRWATSTTRLDGRSTSVICTGPVLIVLNKLPSDDEDIAAVLDRFDAVRFQPSKEEIITRMRALWPADRELIDLLAELPGIPSLRTLVRARRWQRSPHLEVIEELLDECGAPQPVVLLATIMVSQPENTWCRTYRERTGLTDRSYRRHKRIAEQLVACRPAEACPIVRAGPSPTSEPADGQALASSPENGLHVGPDRRDELGGGTAHPLQ